MKNALLILCSLLLLSLTGCNDSTESDSGTSASGASSVVQQYNTLVRELQNMGIPSSHWSEVQLDLYESRLNLLARLREQASSYNGHDGVVIYGLASSNQIAELQRYLGDVREQKALTEPTFPKPLYTGNTLEDYQNLESEYASLNSQRNALVRAHENDDATRDQLRQEIDLLKKMISNLEIREAFISDHRTLFEIGNDDLDQIQQTRIKMIEQLRITQKMLDEVNSQYI